MVAVLLVMVMAKVVVVMVEMVMVSVTGGTGDYGDGYSDNGGHDDSNTGSGEDRYGDGDPFSQMSSLINTQISQCDPVPNVLAVDGGLSRSHTWSLLLLVLLLQTITPSSPGHP